MGFTLNRFKFEVREVVTLDNYVLQIFKISKEGVKIKTEQPPILMQTGLFDSADGWVMNDPKRALPFVLANAGMRVWLGNVRGSKHSRKYINEKGEKVDPKSKGDYWKFTFEDMATKDLPAMISTIKTAENVAAHTGIDYIGHSQGTLIYFVYCSMLPQECNANIRKTAALAPVSQLIHFNSNVIKFLGRMGLAGLMRSMEPAEMMSNDSVFSKLGAKLCYHMTSACKIAIEAISDEPTKENDENRLPVLFSHFPSGTSTYNFVHFGQLVNTKKFRRFDYGKEKNQEVYHQETPPDYNKSKIQGKRVCLIVGKKDGLATVQDNQILAKEIKAHEPTVLDEFGHITFLVTKGTELQEIVMDCLRKRNKSLR